MTSATIQTITSIITPLLLLGLSGIGWVLKNRLEQAYELEKSLRPTRVDIYNAVLEPFIMLFTKEAGVPRDRQSKNKTKDEIAQEIITSLDYKKTAFELALIGSDEVVKAFNELMQYFYSINNQEMTSDPRDVMHKLGYLLLEIRKSSGNQRSKLHHFEMLEWMITDLRKYKINGQYPDLPERINTDA